jgi:hypothetical protein
MKRRSLSSSAIIPKSDTGKTSTGLSQKRQPFFMQKIVEKLFLYLEMSLPSAIFYSKQ